jgi:2,3,4,5-tetrahydropyridine-2-carboxylate N-succinyltransferase
VLEPLQAAPVIVEDGAFIGSRCVVVEGAVIGEGAVLGANTWVSGESTRVIDVTGDEPVEHRGFVPRRSIVIPGIRTKQFPAGEYGTPVALIIGRRSASTDLKTSLNQALRDHGVAV